MHPADRRKGFSLLEVMVALTVGGLILLAVGDLFGSVDRGARRVLAITRAANASANRERTLRELFGRAVPGADTTRSFAGFSDSLRFSTWCPSERGWLESCVASMRLVRAGGRVRLEAETGGRRSVLLEGSAPASLFYLRSAALGGEWLPRWGEAVTPPLAVMVVFSDRRLMLRIGERG